MDLVAFGGAAAGTIVALIQFKNGQIPVGSLLIIILLSSEFLYHLDYWVILPYSYEWYGSKLIECLVF